MHCPQCSTQINDSQAVFCPRCGTRLQRLVVQPAVPTQGWTPVPGAPEVAPRPQALRSAMGRNRDDIVRIGLCALIGALLLGWATYVTVILNRIPGTMSASFMVYHDDPTNFSYEFEKVVHLDDADAWLGALFGLLVGAGLGWYLTQRKTH